MKRSGWMVGLGVLAMVAGACGSTVKASSGGHGSNSSGLGLPSAGNSSGGGAAGGTLNGATPANGYNGGALSGTQSGGSGGSYSAGGTGGGGGSVNGVTSTLVPASGPGITNSTVYIGLPYSSQSAQADRAIGAAGAAPSYDARNVYNAVINYANAHGGFAGRKLQALYYDYNLTTDFNTQDQASCAYWTQDNKSFFIVGGTDIRDACGQNVGAVVIGSGSATEAIFQKYPNMIDPDATALDRLGAVTASGLYKAGYFAGKLGLVTWDDPNYRATIQNGYMPTLSSHHITPLQTVYIAVPQQIGALGDMSAAVSSAVTKFKSLGIDHVIIQDGPAGVWSGDGLTFEWMNQAKSQNYYPRYGGNAGNAPGFGINPSDEENKMLAIDNSDYDAQYDKGWHTNQARTQCFQIEAQAGYPVSSSNQNDEGIAGAACDYVFFMQKVINSLPRVTAAGFVAQAQTLGTSFPSAIIYGTKLLSGRRDGGDEFRTEEYFSSCSCLQYQGPPYYPD
ncbi:MAG TPA: hypothetical protein VE990_09720 [Acidimicrobiales bacterium]|nr:hypothetical protein [Acidimicrobiales bacterium]